MRDNKDGQVFDKIYYLVNEGYKEGQMVQQNICNNLKVFKNNKQSAYIPHKHIHA